MYNKLNGYAKKNIMCMQVVCRCIIQNENKRGNVFWNQ